jgi:hypothetical protein
MVVENRSLSFRVGNLEAFVSREYGGRERLQIPRKGINNEWKNTFQHVPTQGSMSIFNLVIKVQKDIGFSFANE